MPAQKIVTMKLSELRPAGFNPRKISPASQKNLANSIKRFGMVQPIIFNTKTGNVVGGHQRLAILKASGTKETDVVQVSLSANEEKALNVALNNINGEWDYDKLTDLLTELKDSDFKLDVMGFTKTELDAILKDDGEIEREMSKPGLTPDQRLVIFEANAIKQIVLYLPTKKYLEVLKRLQSLATELKLDNHTDVFLHLLKAYDATHRR